MRFGARAYVTADIVALAEAGFDFAEIDCKDPQALEERRAELIALQEQYGIAYLAHGPNEGDPTDVERIARVVGPVVCRLLDIASELGIPLFTQHLWLDPRFLDAALIARKLDILATWVDHAAQAGIALCIENLSEHAAHFARAFTRLPALGMTLDLGHGQILSTPNAAFGFLDRFPERIRHVHLHDNYGGRRVSDDLHLPIGQGQVDFRRILRALRAAGYSAGLSLEVGLEHVRSGRARVQALWDAAADAPRSSA
jgi:sugar phosphate isomerase/epimerase